MSEETLWLGVHYLHLVAMAFFVGGQLVIVAAVLPVERDSADRSKLRAIARRFGVGSLLALGVLAATGTAMAIRGGYWSDGTLQLKLVVVGLVIGLTTLHLIRPRVHALSAAILLGSLVIAGLGLDVAH